MSEQELHEIEKSMLQILISKGIIEKSIFDVYFQNVLEDYNDRNPKSIYDLSDVDMFRKINNSIRDLSIEIKTLVEKRDSINSFFHGIVNIDEDYVAKTFGSSFNQIELKFFSDLIPKLIESGKLNSREIELSTFKNVNWSTSDVTYCLQKLKEKGWLQRDDRNYWILGARTHLELRAFIENAISNADDENKEDEKQTGLILSELPQIIVY